MPCILLILIQKRGIALLHHSGKMLRYLQYYGSVMYEVHSLTINLDALHFIHYNTKVVYDILH